MQLCSRRVQPWHAIAARDVLAWGVLSVPETTWGRIPTTGPWRWFVGILATLVVFSGLPLAARADVNTPLVIGSDVLVTTSFPVPSAPHMLMVQATSWPGQPYRYLLLVGNFSPWAINSLRLLDRYFPADLAQEEIIHEWLPGRLEPGQTTSFAIEFPAGPFVGGCHQLEISMANALHTILMDCSLPGTTTLWDVPLKEEAKAYLASPVVTLPQPVGGSKLGLHVTSNNSPKIMDFVRQAHPAVVVAVSDLGWLADVKAESPQTVTVGRFIEGDQTIGGDPVECARAFVRANVSRYLAYPGVDYWLGWNEPTIASVEQMNWFAAFEAERASAMAEWGLKVAIGNFSAGTPEADEFQAFLPALVVARKYGGILALHEYSAPTMRAGVGSGIPGLEAQPEQGALTLRYRNWYNNYLVRNNAVLPLVITEAGIDGGVLGPGVTSNKGWRDFLSNGSDPPSPESVAEYLAQLSWYDDELRRDPHVLGFAIFNTGNPKGQWKSFDVTAILSQLADFITSKR